MKVMEENEAKYKQDLKWWKNEATSLDKECELNVNQLHQLKSEVNCTKYKQNNIDSWKKRCYLLYWKRFNEYICFQNEIEQIYDLMNYLKTKFMKISERNSTKKIENKQNKEHFKDSFRISMYKSLKDVENIDIDQLLLCQDAKELSDFLLSSNMSPQLELKVAAQLLPVVEDYRIKLQKDINKKIDKFTKKLS